MAGAKQACLGKVGGGDVRAIRGKEREETRRS